MFVRSWPQAIVHIDGDAFFAACEQAINPSLKGKPVVTGKERNIVAAASYEAKALGISRRMELWEAKKLCPQLIVLPSDYETYSLFSTRMYEIMRRFTPTIEEYSIDEAFAEITGLRRLHHTSYPAIAQKMQDAIISELGITVSVGVSLTKTLAKIGSRKQKPRGFTVISGKDREKELSHLPITNVWNIGPNTSELLQRFGIRTALDFATTSEEKVKKIVSKPGFESWQELNGHIAWKVNTQEKEAYQTISKTKTFTPPSSNKEFVFAQLMKNVESVCMKSRRFHQASKKIVVYLKLQSHQIIGLEVKLTRASCYPKELMVPIRNIYEKLFDPHALYRATGIILCDLVPASPTQVTLFEKPNIIKETKRLYAAIDGLRHKYGKYSVHHAVSLPAQKTQHLTQRGDMPIRKSFLLKGETTRQRLPLPLLQIKV